MSLRLDSSAEQMGERGLAERSGKCFSQRGRGGEGRGGAELQELSFSAAGLGLASRACALTLDPLPPQVSDRTAGPFGGWGTVPGIY